jgi:hypothetical protein
MKLSALSLGFCSVLLVLSSCNQDIKEARMKRIDSLGIHLNYVEESLAEMDSAMVQNRMHDIDRTVLWIAENITDTLRGKSGITFGDYGRTKKYLDQAAMRYHDVRKELVVSKLQLQHLRRDVQENFYSDEEFGGYFRTESEAISRLVNANDELRQKYEMSNERYERFKPGVNHMVDSIKAIIYGTTPVGQ